MTDDQFRKEWDVVDLHVIRIEDTTECNCGSGILIRWSGYGNVWCTKCIPFIAVPWREVFPQNNVDENDFDVNDIPYHLEDEI